MGRKERVGRWEGRRGWEGGVLLCVTFPYTALQHYLGLALSLLYHPTVSTDTSLYSVSSVTLSTVSSVTLVTLLVSPLSLLSPLLLSPLSH